MTVHVSLSRVFFPVTTLGPGQRIGIWFQGCSIRCPGCISADTWSQKPADMTVEELLGRIGPHLDQASGVTISGGEPFEQFPALLDLLRSIRPRLQSKSDILVYSGFNMADLQSQISALDGLVDALITGPYIAEAGQTRPLMGSDNQELHLLTDLGRANFAEYLRPRNAMDDRFDLLMDDDGTAWMAGIPGRGDFEKLRSVLHDRGISFQTTEDRHLRS
jgi:anaerobic ribonucleoside-triphosphate reductase activating protein